jgi:hypothetical protein
LIPSKPNALYAAIRAAQLGLKTTVVECEIIGMGIARGNKSTPGPTANRKIKRGQETQFNARRF